MSIEKVRPFLTERGFGDRIREFEVSSATVDLAAAALGVEPGRIAKTLSFDVRGEAVLVVAAGDKRINNPAFKAAFGVKATMLPHDAVPEKIGHAVGGVCPFAVKDGVRVYLDESLKAYDVVFPAAGSSNSAVRLTVDELETLSGAVGWVNVCK
ncbi:MAG: YbaK/EbsC family protein [Clostridia bacterium]|nr:YbaK/EbsC family protein [Clostridia bacterium]